MIIDFHAHIFPEKVAARALDVLTDVDEPYIPVSDGTVSGLLKNMDEWDVDVSVIQPVVMKPSQTRTVNEWVASVCSDRIVGFGGIHPDTDDYKRDIDFVVSLGLRGLKFHAEYQDFLVDDERMLKIYDYALGRGLVILHHAGYDPAFKPPFRSSPQRFARVVEAMRGGVIVAAHLGGHAEWDDVEEFLVGTGIYFDTSMGFDYFPHAQFLRIVDGHGADKVLFGTDAPWSNAGSEIAQLRSLPLPSDAAEAILGGNAARVLGLFT